MSASCYFFKDYKFEKVGGRITETADGLYKHVNLYKIKLIDYDCNSYWHKTLCKLDELFEEYTYDCFPRINYPNEFEYGKSYTDSLIGTKVMEDTLEKMLLSENIDDIMNNILEHFLRLSKEGYYIAFEIEE